MPGYTDDMGAAMVPASAASATPAANTNRYSLFTSMPSEPVISRLLAPARSIMPRRVREITQYSSSATAMPTAEMNSRRATARRARRCPPGCCAVPRTPGSGRRSSTPAAGGCGVTGS
ncbi:hypothetical protein G6F65_020976 [Rhizopus arrhizus]|nr:hypothetical protein G6F65_020976 [Rhizopus arrhizus]